VAAAGRGRPARVGVVGALDAPPVPVDELLVWPVVALVDAPQVWTASEDARWALSAVALAGEPWVSPAVALADGPWVSSAVVLPD
jgi:hypothetical protein